MVNKSYRWKKSLTSFMMLSTMLGIPYVAILDYDALMHREHTIKINDQKVQTSSIIFALISWADRWA